MMTVVTQIGTGQEGVAAPSSRCLDRRAGRPQTENLNDAHAARSTVSG